MSEKEFDSIIPTAILTAYPKTLSDIPYSNEIFEALQKNQISNDLMIDKLAPEIEARVKLIDNLLHKFGENQVLEIASGYSARGLNLANKNSDFTYVEMDLPKVTEMKKEIINSFTNIPENLHIISGNALNTSDFDKCGQFFDNTSPISVVCEGLLRYLDFDEKKIVAKNIYKLLSEHGGVWITCDVTPKKFIKSQDKNMPGFNGNLSKISDRNNPEWRFNDIQHVREFFGKIGFEVESVHSFSEVKNQLVSPAKLGLDSVKVDEMLKDAIVVVMKIKK